MPQDQAPTTAPSEQPSSSTSAEAELYCPFCGYDMRSRFDDACPECGEIVDEATMKRAQVPWANRREIGRIRAIWQTFWRVSFRTRSFARAVGQPVDLKEAMRFRRLVVLTLWLTTLGAAWFLGFGPAVIEFLDDLDLIENTPWRRINLGWKLATYGIPAILLGAWLYAGTGVHTYFFHPRRLPVERQNRAIALSYYACAPLLLITPAIALLVGGAYVKTISDELGVPAFIGAAIPLMVTGGVLAFSGLLRFWLVTAQFAVATADRGLGGRLLVMALQPMAWVLLAAILGGLIPLALVCAYLLATSF